MTHLPPIQFDRATGELKGVNFLERAVACALVAGSKISSNFSYRGYNMSANLIRKMLTERDIVITLNEDARFSYPYGDGYWSNLLDRSFHYEQELELLFLDSRDVDYTLIDCGANYGYWSVLASSKPFGSHTAIAIEPSSRNFAKLSKNVALNGDRFRAVQCAIGSARGTARLSGTKHEAFTIVGDAADDGEDVQVLSVNNLVEDGIAPAKGKFLIKLDVEGVEIEAIKGASLLLNEDMMLLCEEHGSDRNHTVSRYIVNETPMSLFAFDTRTQRFETVTDLSILDRIKVANNVGYNVFATSSAFWQDRINRLNESASRRAQ